MASSRPLRAAVYARVSTYDQEVENQLGELRRFVDARGWEAREYVDEGVSGAVEQRPALDELVRDAKRRRFDVLVCWRLDRLGRSLKVARQPRRRVDFRRPRVGVAVQLLDVGDVDEERRSSQSASTIWSRCI